MFFSFESFTSSELVKERKFSKRQRSASEKSTRITRNFVIEKLLNTMPKLVRTWYFPRKSLFFSLFFLLLLSPCLSALDELSLLMYLPPLLSTLLYYTPLIILSLKLWQLLRFCLLAVLPYCRSSSSCIALLFSIIVFSSVGPSPVSFSIFSVSFSPPVISHSSITCLGSSSFLLHSLHLFSCIPLLSSILSLWSRFHV